MTNFAYQDEIATELLDGKIIAMSPRPVTNHDIVALNIYYIFRGYLTLKS